MLMIMGALGLWIASSVLARVNFDELLVFFPHRSPATILPPLFWLAIPLATMPLITSLLMGGDDNKLLMYLVLITIIIHFTPTLVQENARIYDSFTHMGMANAIMWTSHTDPATFGYHSWPGAFIFASIFLFISGLHGEFFMYFFPVIVLVEMVIGLFMLARMFSKISKKIATMTIFVMTTSLIFIAENNSLQTHFSPQALGFLMVIYFIGELLGWYNSKSTPCILLCVLLFAALTITHPVSSLFTVLFLLTLSLTKMKWFRSYFPKTPHLLFIITIIAVFLLWNIYGAYQVTEMGRGFIMAFLDFFIKGLEAADYLAIGTPQNLLLSHLSVAKHSFFFSLGLYGFYYMFRKRDSSFLVVLSYALGIALFFAFLLIAVRGMLWERTLLYGSLPIALSGAYAIHASSKRVKGFLLLMSSIFLLVNTYIMYDTSLDTIVLTSELTTADFLIERGPVKLITMYTNALISFRDPFYQRNNVILVTPYEYESYRFTNPAGIQYVVLSKQMQSSIGEKEFYKLTFAMDIKFNKIYYTGFNYAFGCHNLGC